MCGLWFKRLSLRLTLTHTHTHTMLVTHTGTNTTQGKDDQARTTLSPENSHLYEQIPGGYMQYIYFPCSFLLICDICTTKIEKIEGPKIVRKSAACGLCDPRLNLTVCTK